MNNGLSFSRALHLQSASHLLLPASCPVSALKGALCSEAGERQFLPRKLQPGLQNGWVCQLGGSKGRAGGQAPLQPWMKGRAEPCSQALRKSSTMAALEGRDGQCWGEQLVHSLLEADFVVLCLGRDSALSQGTSRLSQGSQMLAPCIGLTPESGGLDVNQLLLPSELPSHHQAVALSHF